MIPHSGRLNQITGWGARLLDLVFPPRCVNCKHVSGALCANCLATLRPITTPTCARCGHPLVHARAQCSDCRAHPLHITKIQSVVWHDGALREAIHALKYSRRRDVAIPLANLMADHLTRANMTFDLVTSVPLHPTREQERGYNQAELLARHLAQTRALPYQRLLTRTRATADQIGLDGKARRINVADAFDANPIVTADKNVLLIDDVCTTGATLDACAVALFQGGARTVTGLTVARPRSR